MDEPKLKSKNSGRYDMKGIKATQSTKFSYGEDENKERGNWSGRLDFLLSCVGFAVGLGNIWRFPYLCYRNGGGAFLIPYVLMLACIGLPLFFFEVALGQFASLGPISVWRMSPAFKGVGYGMITISGIVCIYYNVVIAYVIFYFFASFTSELPWASCNNTWNTDACAITSSGNGSRKLVTPSQEYFDRYVLDRSPGLDTLGEVRWQLALCLLAAWVIVFLCLIKGIKSSGKVVYFTALFPYVVLLILFVRGVTLSGAGEGIEFYIVPKWEALTKGQVWRDAAEQIFYSLGTAWGGLITMSSYNRFHNNCYRDSILVAIINCGTSIFAGFAIFSVIGHMASQLNVPIDEVTNSGPGLIFVAYPAGIALMPIAPLWSILFFFMVFTLGLDSMFAMMETVISALADEFPRYLRTHKTLFTMTLCIAFYLLGLPMTTQGGIYIFDLTNAYSAGYSLLVIGLVEIAAAMFLYGYKRFSEDIKTMLGFAPNPYWTITWCFLTPASIVFIIIFNAISYAPPTYNGYVYPDWGYALGWLMVASSLVWIPVWIVIKFCQHVIASKKKCPATPESTSWIRQAMQALFTPEARWGPALEKHRQERAGTWVPVEDPQVNGTGLPPRHQDHENLAYAHDPNSEATGNYRTIDNWV